MATNTHSTIVETTRKRMLHGIDQAMDLIVLYGSRKARGLLIHGEHLSEDFYNLKTRLAGDILQKFANYGIRAALVVEPKYLQGRFGELALELNRGGDFRIFHEAVSAREWLSA